MSDHMNDQNNMQSENDQQTRVIPPVDAASAPVRHRRSEKYHAPQEAEAQQPAEQEAPAKPAEQTTRVQTTRFSVQAPQQREMPSQGVPRPAVLTRVPEKPAAPFTPGSNGVRRPISAPGYSQRQPLGERQPLQVSEQPRVRRPVNFDELDTEYNEEFKQAEKQQKKKGNKLLVALVAIVLVLGLIVLGFLLIPEGDSGLGQVKSGVVNSLSGLLGGGEEKEPVSNAQAMDFSAAPTQGTAPQEIAFTRSEEHTSEL